MKQVNAFFTLCLSVILSMGLATKTHAQTDDSQLSLKEQRQATPKYISIGIGLGNGSLRDFATSPLTYTGPVGHISLSKLRLSESRESEYGFAYDRGRFVDGIEKDGSASATLNRFSLFYSRLYAIGASDNYNIKVGGALDVNGNFRKNLSLLNNGIGAEVFGNLFASAKITKDISRTEDKEKKRLFGGTRIKKARKRNLGLRLDLGLINTSYRNGYIYSTQGNLIHYDEIALFDNHEFNAFSGFRMRTRLDYTHHLLNKNAIQVSYLWDAYKTGGDLDQLEMAFHTLKFTLLFNTNNK